MKPSRALLLGAGLAAAALAVGLAMSGRAPTVRDTLEVVDGFKSYAIPGKLKYTPRLYAPGEIKPILTVHVTDVDGGFGVREYQWAPWAVKLANGQIPGELLAQLPADKLAAAKVLALAERFRKTPYHVIGSRVLGTVLNYPMSMRTSHGDAGNMGPGWALDAAWDEAMGPDLIEVGIDSLVTAIEETAKAASVGLEDVVVVPHRVWDAGRRVDPGEHVWRAVVLPAVKTTGATIGYNTQAGSGLWIPSSWDPAALYDDSGNRLEIVS